MEPVIAPKLESQLVFHKPITDIEAKLIKHPYFRKIARAERSRLLKANRDAAKTMPRGKKPAVRATPVQITQNRKTKRSSIRFAIPLYDKPIETARVVAYKAASTWRGIENV